MQLLSQIPGFYLLSSCLLWFFQGPELELWLYLWPFFPVLLGTRHMISSPNLSSPVVRFPNPSLTGGDGNAEQLCMLRPAQSPLT